MTFHFPAISGLSLSVQAAKLYPKHWNFLERFKKWIDLLPDIGEFCRISPAGASDCRQIGPRILAASEQYGFCSSYPLETIAPFY
jgi:hypothetical protein